jgi:Pyruvate/2-oxoacid:ferredoxin oxidoreductase gamma subunit
VRREGAAPEEREVFMTGIGGQGVQLAAKILALAATREGRSVMSLGTYGGTMRGGNTDSTVVVANGPISAPPIVSRGWSAIVVHPRYWEPLRPKLRPNGVVVCDASLVDGDDELDPGPARLFSIDASSIARQVDATRAGSLVLLGAYCGVTGIVALESIVAAMREAVPPYRQQHIEANAKALEAGFAALPALAAPAWSPAPEGSSSRRVDSPRTGSGTGTR